MFQVLVLLIVGIFNKLIFSVFIGGFGTIEKETLGEIRDSIFIWVLLVLALDFWQVILGGTLRALVLQDIASVLYFVSYYLILTPISVLFAFYVGSHTDYAAKASSKVNHEDVGTIEGMGLYGQWIAIFIGLSCQVVAQLLYIHKFSDWQL